MARYTGPKHKLARREGVNIIDKTSVSLQRRLNTPPGVHGAKRKRKLSEFGIQLREKQKAKAMYSILEKKLKNIVQTVSRQKGNTAELLVAHLETRLDNIVYRLGFAKSRYQARQFVGHGHILVNGKKVDIPSYQVRPDDVISIKPNSNAADVVRSATELTAAVPPWLQADHDSLTAKVLRLPARGEITTPVSEQLIVELYSK